MDRPILVKRFDDLFTQPTRYKDLDQLLARLHRRKAELLKVLERPEIPLHTNASENDLRAWPNRPERAYMDILENIT
ncbi:MAG: transposase [Pseudotabrizicola sp.]|uniref:transposase n=1 Tax=Pseudotabrizicola sp. TaxID=2939647 RepID=UPI0027174D07|nr:transposase [Pseudotabrizicola sp.]MDO9641070.1 transposase [Pseudotabrizicola sp.]